MCATSCHNSFITIGVITMHKKVLFGGLSLALLATPLSVSGVTLESLQAQVASLMGQLQSMKAGASAGGSSSLPAQASVCATLARSFGKSATDATTGGEVTTLQKYLAQDSSIYPEGLVTGFYGDLTVAAVKRWQVQYGVVSSGDEASTGFGRIGPKTRTAMGQNCGSGGQSLSSVDAQIGQSSSAAANYNAHLDATIQSITTGDAEGYEPDLE